MRTPEPLPDPVTDKDGTPLVFACPICGAVNVGAAPHGEGNPCPLAVRKANAEAFLMNDMKKMLQKLGVEYGEEDE